MPSEQGPAADHPTIGPYELRDLVGAGGMGEVYRAWDPRLRRDVALKLLRGRSAHDPARVARFLAEARAASAVTHPNIVTIFDVATDIDTPYVASELVEGESLAAELRRGALPISRAVDLAAQIADGLAEAHAAGVVHRDLKPGNVMITRSGRAKIVDFGLAEPHGHRDGGGAVDQAPGAATGDAVTVTVPGLIEGTIAYMSPEQARGAAVDARSDQFAFGLMLYEMLSGRRAFVRDTPAATLDAIANEDPPSLTAVAPRVPPQLAALVRRCLNKRPDERYAATTDLYRELRTIRDGLNGTRAVARPRLILAAATASVVVITAGATWMAWDRPTATAATAPAMKVIPIFARPHDKSEPALSPDGSRLVFVWRQPADGLELYVTPVAVERPVRLTYDPSGSPSSPRFSRDGRFVAFRRTAREPDGSTRVTIRTIPSAGGAEQIVASGPIQSIGGGVDWMPGDGSLVYPMRERAGAPFRLRLTTIASGEHRWLTEATAPGLGDRFPTVSDDGGSIAFVRQIGAESSVVRLDVASGRLFTLARGGHDFRYLAWAGDGRSLFAMSVRPMGLATIVRVPLDGGPVSAVAGLGEGASEPSTARLTGQMVFRQNDNDQSLLRVDLTADGAAHPKSIAVSSRNDTQPDLSADGTRLAFTSDRSGSPEVWMSGSDGSAPIQLTQLGTSVRSPSWSPDGRQIAFAALTSAADTPSIHVVDIETRRVRRLTFGHSRDLWPTWSRDGATIYFRSDASGLSAIWSVAAAGGTPVRVTEEGARRSGESADGRWLYYSSPKGIKRIALAGGSVEQISAPGRMPTDEWIVRSQGLFVAQPAGEQVRVSLLDVDNRRLTRLFETPGTYSGGSGIAVSRDGRVFVLTLITSRSTLMLAEPAR